jgi:hypothetical protein
VEREKRPTFFSMRTANGRKPGEFHRDVLLEDDRRRMRQAITKALSKTVVGAGKCPPEHVPGST